VCRPARAVDENAAFSLAVGRAAGGQDRHEERVTWTIDGVRLAFTTRARRADLPSWLVALDGALACFPLDPNAAS
jgi:hypothetical protein